MKKLFLFVFVILISCSTSLIKTGAISDQNIINISSLQVGMTQDQVLEIMGSPYKTEVKTFNNVNYEVWYYITEPTILGQTQLITRNFTPLVFVSNQLKGWGRNFYKFTFKIENENWKKELEKKQQTINENLTLPSQSKDQSFEDQRIENINRTILEAEQPDVSQENIEEESISNQLKAQPQTNQVQPITKTNESQIMTNVEKKPFTTEKPTKKNLIKKNKSALKKQPELIQQTQTPEVKDQAPIINPAKSSNQPQANSACKTQNSRSNESECRKCEGCKCVKCCKPKNKPKQKESYVFWE